jgi:spermidine/putrescine transport system substrate-binding protein
MKRIIALLVALCCVLLAGGFACGPKKPKLFVYNWSNYIPDEVVKDFEAKFNCEVVYDVFSTNEEMYTKLKAGGSGYDITFPSADYVSIMIKEGMLAEIDKSKIPNFSQLDPLFLAKIKFDKGNGYSIPFMMGAAGIAVNTKYVKNYQHDFHIFERTDLKGRMTLLDEVREVLGNALITLGYSANSTDPAQLAKAKALVLKWKGNVQKFDSESFGKSFAAGEFWVVHGYGENVFKEVDEEMKKSIDFFVPRRSTMYMDSMVILKDSKSKDLAYTFINFIHEPENYARIVDALELPSINVGARAKATKKPIYSFENLKECEMQEDLGDKIDLYNSIWQEIRLEN